MQKGKSWLAQIARQAGIPVLNAGGPIRGTRADSIVVDDTACPKCGNDVTNTLLMKDPEGEISCFDCVAEQAYIKENGQ
ncbi:hypothetical protein [Providencia phage Kokobel2]|nr:hypothetical protein [Providencia phage Kokobel2]